MRMSFFSFKQGKNKKTELLFITLILRMLKMGGRSATIVPDGVLFGSSKAHLSLRKTLVDENQLEAVISLPSGVFKHMPVYQLQLLSSLKAAGQTIYFIMMCRLMDILWMIKEK
jgi:hypothetical protein